MYWRVARGGCLWDEMRGAQARQHFRDLVSGGKVQGLLAFQGNVPIGWVCVGLYADFPRLDTVRAFVRRRPPETWSIVCFYIPSKHRRAGLATKLLVAARNLALAHGARAIEGYPVTVNTQQGLPGAFAWTGVPAMFEKAGFRRLGDASVRRVWVAERETGGASSAE